MPIPALRFAPLVLLAASPLSADPLPPEMQGLLAARPAQPAPLAPMHATPCVNGFAGVYPCSNIDLLAFEPVANFTASATNSLWGWTDPATGKEYALVGANNGTAFYDLSTPDHPRYLGKLPTHAGTGSSSWRDVRTYANHAFVVSDNNGAHGMQVFDLTRLRSVTTPQTFTEDAFYSQAGTATLRNVHTIAINEQTGYAYLPGSNTCGGGGLHMVDIRVPTAPVFAGCGTTGHYVHETQCWNYAGPDAAYAGHEICIEANGPTDSIAIVDVTNKAAPVTIASRTYPGAGYPHQGWLTDDHRYLLVNDELDESSFGHNARTYVWDLFDLDAPVLRGFHQHALPVIDHNLYVHGRYVYQSNYEAGLRILEIGNLSQAQLTEVAYFDTYPGSNARQFNGNWNNYRFPGSGIVIATGIDEGLFVLLPNLCTPPAAPANLSANPNGDGRIDLTWSPGTGTSWRVERAQGGCGGTFFTVADALATSAFDDTTVSGQVTYGYRVSATTGATCASAPSACVEAATTGTCTAPPFFAGITQAQNGAAAACRVDLAWNPAVPSCGATTYSVYRDIDENFAPSPSNRIAQGLTGSAFSDTSLFSGQSGWYVVRAADTSNGAEDPNTVARFATATGPNIDGTFATGAEPGEPFFDSTGGEAPAAGKAVRHAGWHTSMTRVHGGTQSFWSTQATNLCATLISPPLLLTSGQQSQLTFWSAHDIRAGDAAVVEASTDGGNSWTRLVPAGGYGGTVTTGGALCGIAQGAAAWTNPTPGATPPTPQLAWVQRTVNLAQYAGVSVQLRFLYRTDGGTAPASLGEGWYVDDIAISHAQIPGPCAGVPELLANGFE
jgi:choice-of-anchor B domain-containing protein